MIHPEFEKWNQSAEEIRQLSLKAEHERSRERFQALYMIGTKQTNASWWSWEIGRCKQTVLRWVHTYNAEGPEGLMYQHSGGSKQKLSEAEKKDRRNGHTNQAG